MRTDPEGIFEAAIDAYRLGEFELSARYFAEDCDFVFGGAHISRQAIFERFAKIARELELLRYEPREVIASGDSVRAQIAYAYRHRACGDEIDGVGRAEATFHEGKIVKWQASHDADRIKAFTAHCRSKAFEVQQDWTAGPHREKR
ncbi:MAG: nuclear transport factor 2 family protein [Hyphomicrobium sp.]